MSRAWVIHEYAGFQGLSLENVEQKPPGPGQVRLRIEAFALNWGDMDLMHDRYSFSFTRFPAKIGMEAAGIVEELGDGVTGIEVGQRYCTLPYFYLDNGASGDSLVIEPQFLARAPDGLSAVESASIWMQYLTAYYPIVELSKAAPGKNFLVTAATSTAGSAALEWGRLCGARMIGTTRFAKNTDYLKDMGADHVLVTEKAGWADELKEITQGEGLCAAFDPVGGGMISQYAAHMGQNAHIYFYGSLDEQWPSLPVVEMFQTNTGFYAYSLFHYVQDPAMCEKGKERVYAALADGSIRPRVDKVYPMEGYKEAWEYLSQPRDTHGKVVIETGL
ncbi:MAG: zinc-binding dehydrogenase [Lysobacterales bacterium]